MTSSRFLRAKLHTLHIRHLCNASNLCINAMMLNKVYLLQQIKYLDAVVDVSSLLRRAAMANLRAILKTFIGESDITKPISDNGKILKYREKYRSISTFNSLSRNLRSSNQMII